jgi:hypothetical protein
MVIPQAVATISAGEASRRAGSAPVHDAICHAASSASSEK